MDKTLQNPMEAACKAGSRALGLSGSRALGLSGSRALGLSGSRALGLSGSRALGLSGSRVEVFQAVQIFMKPHRAVSKSQRPGGFSVPVGLNISAIVATRRKNATFSPPPRDTSGASPVANQRSAKERGRPARKRKTSGRDAHVPIKMPLCHTPS
jgi:hypothetical protein